MYVIAGKVPAKLFIKPEDLEASTLEQIKAIMECPGVVRLSVMPDAHLGKGACVGAVVATVGVVYPNIVGVDIGCGVDAIQTDLQYNPEIHDKNFWHSFKGAVDRNIPTGFNRHTKPQFMPKILTNEKLFCASDEKIAKIVEEVVPYQLGTLGGGNHFLEASYDENNYIWLLVHSGSRHIGLRVATHYEKIAKALNDQWYSPTTIPFLPTSTPQGQQYLFDMDWCLEYAKFNRDRMLLSLIGSLNNLAECTLQDSVSIHHNFANYENHNGQNLIVHRKGAVHIPVGTLGIVPGSMGTNTYIVEGLGNKDALDSCAHGAGRTMSRTQARKTITQDDFAKSMADTYTSPSSKLIDESPGAYKNIETVMASQSELVKIMYTLKPIITIKGEGNDN